MGPNEYQELAGRTLLASPDTTYSPDEIMWVWNATGLAGEAGEVVDHIKKVVFHRHALDRDKMKKELGDTLWYLTALCTKFGFSLEDVMQANIEKLKKRYPNGYNSEDSISRMDVVNVQNRKAQ